jgi:hypothetical protein
MTELELSDDDQRITMHFKREDLPLVQTFRTEDGAEVLVCAELDDQDHIRMTVTLVNEGESITKTTVVGPPTAARRNRIAKARRLARKFDLIVVKVRGNGDDNFYCRDLYTNGLVWGEPDSDGTAESLDDLEGYLTSL